MRLTTRLMQLASWLLLHRAVKEGEMSIAQANREKTKVKLTAADPAAKDLIEKLPASLQNLIERSVALNPKNAHGAHGFAHVCYERGEPETARAFLLPWLAEYPRDGFFYGHLSWHLSLVEIALGHLEEAQQLYRDAI